MKINKFIKAKKEMAGTFWWCPMNRNAICYLIMLKDYIYAALWKVTPLMHLISLKFDEIKLFLILVYKIGSPCVSTTHSQTTQSFSKQQTCHIVMLCRVQSSKCWHIVGFFLFHAGKFYQIIHINITQTNNYSIKKCANIDCLI